MNSVVRLFAFIITVSALQATHAADILDTTVTNPQRAFGYTLGDVLEQKIALSIDDTVHTLQSLPAEQRVGRWVTRSAATISDDAQWLTIQYQLINAPPDVRVVALPALTLATETQVDINVPAWPFSIAPLLPAVSDTNNLLPAIQADELASIPASESLWRNLLIMAIVLSALLAIWLAWWLWRNWREARALPFAHAHHAIRHVARGNDAKNNEGWLIMHNAFNQSAGRSIVSSTVIELSRNCSWLKPFESEINQFFALSSTRFFAPESQHEPFDIINFSKRLYQAEKRYTTSISDASLSSTKAANTDSSLAAVSNTAHDKKQADTQGGAVNSPENTSQSPS